jgi:hypothetical protein
VSSAFWYAVQSSRKLRPFDKYGQQLAARKQPSEGCRRLLDQLPPKPSNLTSTQQEQGFFKRLVTSSFDDQLVKVEQALLPTTAQTFEDLTDRILLSGPPLKRPEGEREALLRNISSRGHAARDGRGSQRTTGELNEVRNTMSENQMLLLERGEKIERVQNKAQELADETAQFAELCKQLKQKQRSSWF